MGGLNSGPGPGITLLIAFVLVLCSNVLSAPLYEEDDTQDSNGQDLIEPQGCYYNFQHYNEGERILTNEPCLNCTCRNRMLMCYLRVCPFTKGIGQNCTVEKVPGQCCPIITCPEVPVQLLTSSTTEHSESDGRRPDLHHGIKGTAVGHLDNSGCQIDGVFYPNGAQVPGSPEKPCELCYCIRNKTACIMQSCALHVDGCRPIYEEGQCFPVRYQCDDQPYEEEPTTTIRPAPTPGLIITTTSSEPLECYYNNEIYEDGSRIKTEDPCEHCYCLKGKIACAVQECGAPLEKEGQNCTALPPAPGKCCPDSYQCDITMSSQKSGQGSEGTTTAGFSSVEDAGHPTDGHYPGEHGVTKTTEKPKYGSQNGDVTEGLTPQAVTPSREVSGKPSVSSDGQRPHLDKGQPGSQDSTDLDHHKELDKETQSPIKHQDSLPNEYEGRPEDVTGQQKITSDDDTKPGITKRPVYGTKPEMETPSSSLPAISGSSNEFVQRQNQSQTDPLSTVHHPADKDKPHGQKPEQYGDEKAPVSGSKPKEPSSSDGTKVQDGIQTAQDSGQPTTEPEHILHVMEQQKPAPGIESHVQDTSSTQWPFTEGLSNLNAYSTESTGSTKPTYDGHWKPQPGIYQPDLQGTPFDVSQEQMSPDRIKPVFPGSDKLPEDNYGYSTPIPAIDEDQNVKGQMNVTNAKDQLIDKLHNIIQDVQAQVNDGKTTEMPEEADYKTTTQSQKGHFAEKLDTLPHLHPESQNSHHPFESGHGVATTKPTSDKETQQGNAVTDIPKDTSDIFNKIQGIIHGMFTQVTEAVQTTLAPLTAADVDGKKPSKGDEGSSSASPEHKPDATDEFKPTDGSSKHPQETKPTDSYEHPVKVGSTGAPDDSDQRPQGSGSYYPQGSSKYPGSTQTWYPDSSKPEDSEYPSITQYPDYISPDNETGEFGKYPEGTRPGNKPYGSSKYPEGSKPEKYPHGTEYSEKVGSTIQPGEHDNEKPVDKIHGMKYPTEHSKEQTKFPGGVKPPFSQDPSVTNYPDDQTSNSQQNKYPEGFKPSAGKPHHDEKYPQGTTATESDNYLFGTEYPERVGVTGRPQGDNKYPLGTKPSGSQEYPQNTEYPDTVESTMTPEGFEKYPDGTSPVKGSEKVKFPEQIASTGKPHYSTKYPGSKYPERFTGKPTDSEDAPHGTEGPEEFGVTGKYPEGMKPTHTDSESPYDTKYPEIETGTDRPYDSNKYPEESKPTSQKRPQYPHGTEYPDEIGTTDTPNEFGKYPGGTSPEKLPEKVKYPGQTGSTGRPHYSTKYPGSKYPEGFTGKPIGSEHEPYSPEYPGGVDSSGGPQDLSKYPEGFKPTIFQKHPHHPQGTEYPDEVGLTVTPDEFGKYPDGTSPVKGSEDEKYPEQTGSTSRPHYSTKYPGSKYPERFTGKPTDSEDAPHGTEGPEEFGVTGKYPEGMKPTHTDSESPYDTKYPEIETGTDRPYDSNKYPEESKPTSQKRPQYPHGTEYPDEIGSTDTPDEFGKYPEGTSPVKGPQGVKHPSQTGSTFRPQYITKHPGSKYPEEITGKPTGSEDGPHDTEYPEENEATGGPQHVNKYPLETKPSGSQKYPYGTQYPDLVESTVTPDEFGKYPDGTTSVKGSEGVKYPGQSGSTSNPQDLSKYPEGTKPSSSQKFPHGTEYPDDVGSTVTPDEFGKYPDGTGPVEGSGGVKYPTQTESTVRPHYSTKYPGSKYPAGFTGKPTDSEDQPYGTEYPEGVGVTGRPEDSGKYPERVKPTHPESEGPYGTEYPEGDTGTDRPYDSNKYPEGSKPIRGPDSVLYPSETGSTSRPQVEDQYLEVTKPSESEERPLGSEYPKKESGTDSSYGANKYPGVFKPNEKHPGESYSTDTELPEYSTTYPNEYDFNVTPDVSGKFPHGSKPASGIYRPDNTKYPDHKDTADKYPHYPSKYPDGFDSTRKPQGSTQHFGRPTEKPFGTEEYPYHTEYPEGFTGKPDDLNGSPDPSRPVRPQDSKHPTGSPFDSTRFPVGSRPTFRPKHPESSTQIRGQDNLYETQSPYEPGVTSTPQTIGKYPSDVSKYPDDSKLTYSGKDPETGDSEKLQDSQTDYPEGVRPSSGPQVTSQYPEGVTDKPYSLSKYPEGSKPSDKYPFGTDYPEGIESTVTPDKFGKYPDGTSPVKGEEGEKHPNQTGSTEKPHYPTKYPGSKYPEGITNKPFDSEDESYGTKYPEGVGVTHRPQSTGKYPEKTKPTLSDLERPYGNEYPEGETETDRPYGSSKYPDGKKPEEVNYPGQTGSTGRPHYSTKYPESKFPEEMTDTEQEAHPTKYPEDVGVTGRPEYSEKYPEKVKPVEKPDELGKYPGGAKAPDSNQLSEEDKPGKQPEDEEYGTGRPYDLIKYPEGYRPNDKYPEGLKPTDLQESTKVPDDVSSPESVTDHQHGVGSTDRASTDRPDSIKHPEGYKPTDDTQDSDKHPDESKPTNKDEFTPETNIPSDQKKHGKPGEEGLKPQQTEKSPEDPENINQQGVTDKPDGSSKYTTGAQTTSSDQYPHSTKYQDKTGSTTKPDEFGKRPEQYEPDGKPGDSSKFPEGMTPEEAGKVTDNPYDSSKYSEGTKPVQGSESVKYPEQIGSTGRPHYSTKYPTDSEDQPHGTGYLDKKGVTGRPIHSKYPEESKPTSQKRPQYPYGTEHPDEIESTVTPDDYGKLPDGTSPVEGPGGVKYPHGTEYSQGETGTDSPYDPSKYPEGNKPVRGPDEVKYPAQNGSTGKPHYSTKYPETKYPEGFTDKPTDSQNESHGTEYPGVGVTSRPQGEEFGSTGRPQDLSKYPEGTKPSSSQKFPHGTEYPDDVGSTVTPDEFGKYPDGTGPVEGSGGVKYPTQTESTVRPHYSTKYPGSKYPAGFTGKPTDSEDQPYGTEYPEGVGVTGRPEDSGKYPERVKPTHPESEGPYGTEYPEGDTGTDRPYDSNKYPEGSKPVREPGGVKYPDQTVSIVRPLYPDDHKPTHGPEDTNKLSESVKPMDSNGSSYTTSQPHETGGYHRPGAGSRPNDKFPLKSQTGSDKEAQTTEFPEGFTGTFKPHDLSKYPEGSQPSTTGHDPEKEKYPESTKVGEKPKDPSKHPQGTRPEDAEHYPYNTKYPDHEGSTGKPYDPNEHPEKSTSLSHVTERPDEETGTVGSFDSTKQPDGSRPLHSTKYPGESQPIGQGQDLIKETGGTKYPEYIGTTLLPHLTSKYPGDKKTSGHPEDSNKLSEDITQPLKKPSAEGDHSLNEYPNEILGTDKLQDSTEYPNHFIPHYTTKRPAGIIPSDLESMSHSTKHPHEPDGKPGDFEKHTSEKEPVHQPEGVTYPSQTLSSGAPHYPTKYPVSHRPTGKPQNIFPEGFTGIPTDSDDRPHGTDPTDKVGVTGRPHDLSKHPDGSKPTPSHEYPHYPHGTEYPDEVGSVVTPDELGKYPDETNPVKGTEEVKYPEETGSTEKPHYPSPGSKYPEGFTGKPIGSEHEPYSPEYPGGIDSNGGSHDLSKYPEGSKPTISQKHPHHPQGTEYPGEVGLTVTPDEFGKYPDGTSPVKGSEDEKYPEQTGSTSRPHYSTKYPGSKYPERFTGKPTDSEDEPHGTEGPEEFGVTGKYPEGMKPTHTDSESPYDTKYPEIETGTDRPYDSNKYPEESKPTSQKRPQYPHGTEYPDEIGSTDTPDEFGKYPEGTSPVKGPQGVKHPSQTGSTFRPQYITKHPGSKYPEEITGKPTGSEDGPHDTEYPEGVGNTRRPQGTEKYSEGMKPSHSDSKRPYGSEYPEGESETNRPYDLNEYSEGTKPTVSQKHPQYTHGTEHPDAVGSTVTPDELEKYPEGTNPVKGLEGMKYPSHTESTGKPQYSTKHPGSKYPERVTGKPSDSEDEPYGNEYLEGVGVTNKPHGTGKYPEGLKPTHPESEPPLGTEYPWEMETVKPYDSNEYPEGTKPVREPEGVKYPDSSLSTGRPHYLDEGSSNKPHDSGSYLEGVKPTDKHPDYNRVTDIPFDVSKFPDESKPEDLGEHTSITKRPDGIMGTTKLHDSGKYPEGVQPSTSGYDVNEGKYPGFTKVTEKPDDATKYPELGKPSHSQEPGKDTDRPHDKDKHPEEPESGHPGVSNYPSGSKDTNELGSTIKPVSDGKHPVVFKPTDPGRPSDDSHPDEETESDDHANMPGGSSKYPDGLRPSSTPYDSSKYSEGVTPSLSEKDPEELGGSRITVRPDGITEYPNGYTDKPHYTDNYPEGVRPTDSDDTPHGTEYPDKIESNKYPIKTRPGVKPLDSEKYPESGKPTLSNKYPHSTEHHNEIGSTVTPDDYGKLPDGTSPVEGPGGVKYPHGTEYSQGETGTDSPYDPSKYPEGNKPVRGPDEVKYPAQNGSTGKPHYSTKYPETKYPEGFTDKPTDSQNESHGTEYPGVGVTSRPQGEEFGSTGRPQDLSKYPEGTKPSSSQKFPHGTEYPDDVGSTVTPDEFGKYPDGTGPVEGSGGVKYSTQTESTVRPHYSTKYPGSKYPAGFTGKPTDSEDQPYGTEYPEGVGVTGRPEDSGKYPERVKPTHSESEGPYGTEYPEGDTGTDRPYDSNKYPEGSKPVRGPDGVKYPSDIESTGRPQGVGEYQEEGNRITENKYPDGVKTTTSKDYSYETQYPDVTGDALLDISSSTSGTLAYDPASKQPGAVYLPQFPQTGKPFSPDDDKDKPLELPEESVKPGHDGYESSTPKGSESDGQEAKPGVPVSVNEMDVTTLSPDEYPKRPDSADLTHDPEYKPQLGEHNSKHPSESSSTQSSDSNLNAQYPSTEKPSTDIDGKVAPQGVKAPQDDLLATRPGFETSYTEKTSSGVSTPKHESPKTERPVQGLLDHKQSTTDQYGHPIKHLEDEKGSTSPGSVNKYSESSDEYSTTEYSPQDEITGKPSGTRPAEHPSIPDQKDVYTTMQPSEGRPTHGVGHPEDISPGSEGFDSGVHETTTVGNDDLINKLQSIIYGIQTQVTNDKTTHQPSTSDLNAPFGQSTEMPYESVIGDRRTTPSSHRRPSPSHDLDEQKPQDHSEQPHESVEYATDKPYVTGDKRRPIGFDGTRPHDTDKPLAGSVDEYTTGLGEETTEGYLEKENEIHNPEGHLGKKPQTTKKPLFDSSTEFSELNRPTDTKHPDDVSSQHPDSTNTESSSPASESSTSGISDEHTPTRKTGSTQVGLGDDSSTPSYDSEKPEGFDSSTKQSGTHHDSETGDQVDETSSTPKDGVLGVTKTPETSDEPQKGVTKPDDKPGGPHGEENVPIYHGVESMEGKPTDQPDSMIGGNHTVLPEENSAGIKKPLKTVEKPSHGVPVDEETGQVTESGVTVDSQDYKHPSHQEPTDKPLHVVYPTYYPDGIITRKPGSRPQDTGNKVTVTPQSNVFGTTPSTSSKEGDDTTQSVDDKEGMRPTGKVPTDGSSLSSGELVTEGLFTKGSTKGAVPQEGFTTGDVTGKPPASVDKHPDSSVDDTQSSGESGTTSPVIIIEEVHTEVHSERATTKPGTESYDQTTKSITSVYPHGFDENLTEKPETFDGKATKKPDIPSHGTDSVFQEGKPGYESTIQPLATDRPQDSLHHTSQPGHGSSVPVSGITESYPDVLAGSTTGEFFQKETGKPAYQTKYPESLDGKSTNEPGLVTHGTTPSSAQSGEPGSQHIMNLYSPKDKYSTTTSPEHKGTEQPGFFTTGSRVPGETDEESLYTYKPDDSHQGPTFDHEIFGSKFPGRKTTQKPVVTPEAQPDFTTVFGVGTTSEPQEGVTSTQTQGTNVQHHVPSFIFSQKQPENGVTSTEGYITQGKPLSTVGQPGVIFEGKQTTPPYQFVTSGTQDFETSTKKPFQPSVKGASYVPYRIIDGRKVYYPEKEVLHKPNETDKHGFDGFDYLPFEIINGKKFFKPNEVVSQPTPTSTTPKHRLGMYVPYKIINGTKVYYTEDPQGKPQPGVEDYDGLDYVPFDIINGTKVFYPEDVKEPTSPASHETTTTPSYIMAMYVPYKVINGTKVYYPEDSPNKPESEDYDGLDYVPFEIVNGKKVFYPERVTTPPKDTSTPSYVMAMYVPYKIINGTKVYYPEDPQGTPQTENYDGLDYVPFEIVNGTKVFYPERVTPTPEATTKPAYVMAMYVPYKIVNGTKVYFPEEPQVGSEEYDGLDYVPFEIVNGTKVFYPERASTTSHESTTTPSYSSAMYVPYKIVDGRKVYYPKYAQYKPYKVPEGFAGFDYIPYEIVNGSKVFYPDRITTLRPTVQPTKYHQGLYLPYKIVNGTKIYYPKDAEEKPQDVPDGYDGSDYVPYEIVNGTRVFYPEKATTEKPSTKAMYVPYKIVDGTKVYYPKDAQPTPNLIPKEYEGFDFVPYDIVNGTKVFYPEKTTTEKPSTKAMYVPYKIVDGTKVYYPKDAQPTPNLIPKGYEGFDFVPYDIVNGTKVFYPERVTTPAPNELYYTQGMYVPYKIVDGRKVYYPQRAHHNPVHIPEGYHGFDYLLYDIVNGTKVFHPERGTASPAPTSAPSGTFYPQGMYVPFRIINGTKVFYPQDAQHNPVHIPEGYEGFDYLSYDIVNGTKVFHPEPVTSSPAPTHAPSGTFYPQGMYVPFRVINGTKVLYPQDAQHRPDPMKNDYDGWQHLPYDIVNGTKVFYPERVTTEAPIDQMSAMYIPFKMINGTKVFYANDAQYQPFLIPEGYDGYEYVPYEIINGTKMFYPDRANPTPAQFPTTARPIKQGMFVPYKIINGAKVYYPKHATDSPRLPSSEYNGVDFIPYEVINGTKVFYPDRIHGPELETSGTQAMYVPYKFVNGTKVFYPKDAQFKPYLIPEGYDGFDYLPYEVKNGTKVFYPERLTVTATQRPEQVPSQGMFVPYKMINGQKVYYPKEAQKRPHPLSSEYDGLDYIPYEVVNGSKVFYPEYVTQSVDMSGTPVSQAMYVPYKIINGTKVFYPKYAQHKPHLVPDGYDGFEYIPYKIVNGTKFFYPDRVVTQPHKVQGMFVPYKIINGTKVFYPKYAQPTLQQLPKGFDGIDYIPYEIVNGTKVFYPEKATPSGVSGTPIVQALYVPYKIINGKKVFYPKNAVEKPQTIPEGFDGFAYMPYSIVNGTKMFYPEQAQFPGINKVPSLQGTFVPYKLLNSTKVFYPKYANDESLRVPDGYDGVDYVPYESVNGTKVFYPELILPQASSGTSPVPGKYVPYKVVNGKKVFYPKEGKPQYPSGGVRYPYDGIVYVPYKDLSGSSPSLPGNYPPFVMPEHSLYGQNSEIVYVDDDDESFRPQFISQSRPSQEQTGSHIGHVPGEGSCFLNNMTYENNMEIQPVSTCQSRCRCINSIVRCVRIKCPLLPQSNTANCSPVYDEGSCCPTYSCENNDLDYLTTTEYPGTQNSSEDPEMVLTGSSSTVISFDSTTQFAVTDESPHKPLYGQDGAGDLSGGKPHPSRKPITSNGQHPTDQYHIHRPQKPKPSEQGSLEPYDGVEGHPMPGEFSGEDDYDGEDEEPYGPGTCRYAGKVYVSAQQIPRDDPCDFCFCFRSDIICLQQSCPPPIPGCRDEPIQGFCCPRYECHVKMATLVNVTSTTTTTTTTLPPHFFLHPYKGSATRTGCFVQGKAYRVGQAIPSASGPCMDCICRGNGRMECEPKVCTPEPMIRKMIVPAENTTSPSSER